jgi:hypothetical protein
MAPNKFIYLNFTLLLSVYSISCYNLRFLGNFTANHPGFLSLIKTKDSGNTSDEYSLYISSFNGIPFTTDHVYCIPSIGRVLQGLDQQTLNRLTVTSLTKNIVWPNEVNQVPGKYIMLQGRIQGGGGGGAHPARAPPKIGKIRFFGVKS